MGGLGGGVWKGGWRSRPPARAVTVGAGGEGCGLSRPRPLHENGKEQRGTAGRLAEGAQLRSPGVRAVTPAALPLGRARRAPGGRPARRRLRTAPGRPPRVPGRPYVRVTTAACLVTGRHTQGSYLQKAASLRELPEAAASHRRAVSATPEPRHAGCLCVAQSAVSVDLWTAWHPGPQRQAGTTSHGPQRRGVGEFGQLPALKWLGDHRRMPGHQRGRRKVPGPGGLSSRSPAHGARTSPRHTGCSSRRSGAGSPAQTAGQTHTLRRPRTARPRAPPRAHCGRLGGDGSSTRHPGSSAAAWTAAPPAVPADRRWPNRRAGRGARPGDGRSPRQDRRLPSCARSTP